MEREKNAAAPGQPTVHGTQHDVDFMLKDSKRFADSGGWGYAAFEYDAASNTFTPATLSDKPPQGNDAKCWYACHTVVQKPTICSARAPLDFYIDMSREILLTCGLA